MWNSWNMLASVCSFAWDSVWWVWFRQEELLHIQQQPSLLGTLQHIFGDDVCSGLKEIDFAQGKLRLSGFLSNSARQLSSKVRMTLRFRQLCSNLLLTTFKSLYALHDRLLFLSAGTAILMYPSFKPGCFSRDCWCYIDYLMMELSLTMVLLLAFTPCHTQGRNLLSPESNGHMFTAQTHP